MLRYLITMLICGAASMQLGAATAPPMPPAPPLGRLSDLVIPLAYRLDLTIDPAATEFQGHTEIDARLARTTDTIFLHGNGLQVDQVRLRTADAQVAARYSQVDASGVARLDLEHPIGAGAVTLTLDYRAPFRNGAEGLFHARVGADWYAWTQFESIDARRVFPAFDEPGFKTPFTLRVRAPAGARVLANAPEIEARAEGALTLHRFATTRPLPTYLIALGVGPFDVLETTIAPNAQRADPLPFRVIATRGQAALLQTALAQGPRLLARLEAHFGSAYPFEKLDFLASPVQLGAMENAGLIIFADSLLLIDANVSSRQLRAFAETCAHELAHQWFGDLVTPAWWNDIWLNESFAEWMGKKVAEEWRPDLGTATTALGEALDAMDVDALGHGRPMHQEIDRNTQIDSAFDAITYAKGAQVLSMFENYLGSDAFAAGIRLYLSRHRYGTATADDFFSALAEAADNTSVAPAMRSFIDQTGVPVVTLERRAGTLQLSQARYRPLGVTVTAPQTWLIPLCLAHGAQHTCRLLDRAADTMPAADDSLGPLMPNAAGAGYYRFALDGPGWDRLIAVAGTLPGREAMVLADSLWADFAAGHADFGRVVAAARALAGNPERQAAVALGAHLDALAQGVLDATQMGDYQRLMRSIYAPRLALLGSELRVGAYAAESVNQRAVRNALISFVALEGHDAPLRARLAQAAGAYLDGDSKVLDPDLRVAALAIAVQDGKAPFLARLQATIAHSSDSHLREDASVAIGLADTPELARIALDAAMAPGMGALDSLRIIFILAAHASTRATAIDYAQTHFEQLRALVPALLQPRLPTLYAGVCDSDQLALIDAFMRPRLSDLGGGQLELTQTEEQIGLCAALKRAKGAQIAAALAGS